MAPPAAKRRKTEPKIEEIVFDPAARQDYLTGFHKRKLQRAKHAQEIADKRAREERIETRKKLREERKADLERHVKQINDLLRPAEREEKDESEEGGEEWEGIEDREPSPVDHEAEYIDEDKYTTVTVEVMDVSKDGLMKASEDSEAEDGGSVVDKAVVVKDDKQKLGTDKGRSKTSRPKTSQDKLKKRKKRDFKYESKTERKVSRTKERLKNSKQARARKAG